MVLTTFSRFSDTYPCDSATVEKTPSVCRRSEVRSHVGNKQKGTKWSNYQPSDEISIQLEVVQTKWLTKNELCRNAMYWYNMYWLKTIWLLNKLVDSWDWDSCFLQLCDKHMQMMHSDARICRGALGMAICKNGNCNGCWAYLKESQPHQFRWLIIPNPTLKQYMMSWNISYGPWVLPCK